MSKILLGESFRNIEYAKKVITFIKIYFDGKFVIFHPHKSIGSSLSLKTMEAIVERELLASRRLEIYDSNDVIETADASYDVLRFSNQFVGKIRFIENELKQKAIVILSPEYFNLNVKRIKNVYFINNFEKEIDSNIAKWIIKKEEILIDRLIKPTIENPLPNIDFCSQYKDVQNELIKGEKQRIPIFLGIGTEVANRNGYIEDKELERLNNGAIRKIFRNMLNKSIVISIDVEHGAIEVYNSKGRHQGEYGYTGSQEKMRDNSGRHDIKVRK